jgi:hypothetical protein
MKQTGAPKDAYMRSDPPRLGDVGPGRSCYGGGGVDARGTERPRMLEDPGKERSRRSLAPLFLLFAAGLVAAALLVLRVRLEPPTVPAYTLVPTYPSAGGDALVLGPSDRFHLDIAPQVTVVGAVGARGFLLRGGDVRAWDPPFTVERDGTVRLDGPVATIFAGVPPGPWDLAVAVGRPETLPTAPRDILRARDAVPTDGDAAWRLVRERIVLGG